MLFTNSRWKVPIERFRDDLYLYTPRGVPYTETSLRGRRGRWLETERGKHLQDLWQKWIARQATKYDWDIKPEDSEHPTIHDLRGTGRLLRYGQGYEIDQIANDIGMSRQKVQHDMRFRDQMQVGAAGQARLKLVENRD
jgi:hypothetical protein